MGIDKSLLVEQLHSILNDYQEQANLTSRHLFVVGCSTSEVIGERIGTAGAEDVASIIFQEFKQYEEQTGVALAFQCCEHLNRALVVERKLQEEKGWPEVTVIPVRQAGGAMAAYAYQHMADPVVVEHITADGGIDIGDTLIGMHIKHVAVPIRVAQKQLGAAHVTLAKARPKLIGGQRAVYEKNKENESC
ncbi:MULTISPECIES: TIGR01440 family protein [Bacillaceae]|uniref:TIGR01440 family protein n=1 Tax=Bacillaceae TaxID=186817 RepID=UPI001E571F4A|nr:MULTISPECIES: TIGR01440 family protein [Bacillaceae]MCE4049698.1 TIGR01440 family protein [Bacillus sp. Au-Bac7]MCM3031868.1 TIGR01440 family protein [Niallia sp. MER 6]MDL0437409.1 TIGR01440 family protein [Niallia sp. SS-2023]UPO87466.1 TIGR01440 family protein [Niallia sp. Man26]